MPFPFRYVCDLLQRLDDEVHSSKKEQPSSAATIEGWFREHRLRLDAPTVDACAILSTLLPERRTDRVLSIQARRLESIIGQAQHLGQSRVKELRRHWQPGAGCDLGDCVQGILTSTPNPRRQGDEVTVEEIDKALDRIGAASRWSSPAIRSKSQKDDHFSQRKILGQFYGRLSARDAKWFTRLILKSYQPVVLEERIVLKAYHVWLPQLMKIRDDFAMARVFIQHVNQVADDPRLITSVLKPALGTKVGRQPWFKGRSIKHCIDMIGQGQASCEWKMDGEYCQIHIDLRKRPNHIQIFSKSGKDSTQDRSNLHRAIKESLSLDRPNCPLNMGCILEGELVVYSEKQKTVLPFHKIRKHVTRSGSFLGTVDDSQVQDDEHLMIIYYDVLLIDNESLLGIKHSERFKRLEKLIKCRAGHAELVQRKVISFARRDAAESLRKVFAECILEKREGLVLKPNDPYFDFGLQRRLYGSCCIKLKKEYFQGFADVGDFAVIGASYNAAKARTYKFPNLRWTSFFIACLDNRERARDGIGQPRFIVTNIVELSETLLSVVLQQCNPMAVPYDQHKTFSIDLGGIGQHAENPQEVFQQPLVFDIRCFSYDKQPNSRIWTMRFPQVSKIHFDRSYLDAITFAELQVAAREATEVPILGDSQEMRRWITALEKADPRGIAVDTTSATSQDTVLTQVTMPSPSSERGRRTTGANNDHLPVVGEETIFEDVGNAPVSKISRPAALMTPPTSSAVQPPDNHGKSNTTFSDLLHHKRSMESDGHEVVDKRPRRHLNNRTSLSTSPSSSVSSSSPRKRCRQPLASIDANALGQENGNASPSSRGKNYHNSALSSPPPQSTMKHIACPHRGPRCLLANCSLILAPCIVGYLWITENLLHEHGITEYSVQPSTLKRCRSRKICLVESRRKGATDGFLKTIEDADLRRSNGEKEWVTVYDWRILEDITAIETRGAAAMADPRKRRYVGLV